MTASTPPPTPTRIAVPMGFSGQLKALQDAQNEQADRIAVLESENAELKASQSNIQELLARVDALEQQNLHLAARRRECVNHLLTLRPLHQAAANTMHLRTQDVQPDDLEGVLAVYSSSVTTTLNHQQRALGQLRSPGFGAPNPVPYPPGTQLMRPPPMHSQIPRAYDENGYCRAHQVPYWCRICGQ
ncbi:hypothetical protein CC86DRAFT_392625 [Ophiobolus disseminans]|uniref:Uncharacterized protein n=1 Tax=Ophiobolus disseminans TaxID=1469910 RepID=A0A6A7AAC3_9PLEO|nr:hypothetical protein CC86DRAFT_392625 [Ophiobolus disseminans]